MMLKIAIAWYMIGISLLYLATIAGVDLSSWYYYGWEKTGTLLILICLRPLHRKIVTPVIWLFVGRILLEVAIAAIGVKPDNDWAIALLFLLATVSVGCILLYRGSKRDVILRKITP